MAESVVSGENIAGVKAKSGRGLLARLFLSIAGYTGGDVGVLFSKIKGTFRKAKR